MSHGTGLGIDPLLERDFAVATPEEFVKRFGGTKVINKVCFIRVVVKYLFICCIILNINLIKVYNILPILL